MKDWWMALLGKKKQHRKKVLKRYLFFILLIIGSLLLHLLMVCGIFHYNFHKKAVALWAALTQNLTPKQQEELKQYYKHKRERVLAGLQAIKKTKPPSNLPARLRAPKSQFGWVLFQEGPEQQTHQVQIPTTLDGDVGQATHAQATEEKPKPPTISPDKTILTEEQPTQEVAKAQKPEMPVQQEQPVEPETKPVVEKKQEIPPAKVTEEKQPAEKASTEQPKVPVIKDLSAQTEERKLSPSQPADDKAGIQQQESIQERIAQIKELQERIATYQAGGIPSSTKTIAGTLKAKPSPVQKERMVGGEGGIRVRGAASIDERPKRNIISLTKGFIEKIDGEEGTDLIDRDGDPDKRPSFEELKYICYESKISWCLQASWKQNFYYRPMKKEAEGDAVVDFTLDEHGNLKECTLLQSTGHPELDALIMKNMKCASPYPPIPKHFGTKTYRTGRIIHVYAQRYNF